MEDANEGEEKEGGNIQQAEKPRYSVVAITAILCYI